MISALFIYLFISKTHTEDFLFWSNVIRTEKGSRAWSRRDYCMKSTIVILKFTYGKTET